MTLPRSSVLLVEDNPGDARLIEHALAAAPGRFALRRASRLAEALALLASERPDAVLLDLSLPDAHGLGTVERVRAAAADVPIVVLTGNDDEALALAALHAGAEDYVVKGSLEGEAIGRVLRYAIERKRTEAELRDSEQFYRALYEHAHHPVFVLDAESAGLDILDANPYACEFYGRTAAELRAASLRDLTLPGEHEAQPLAAAALLREERAHRSAGGATAYVSLNAVEVTRAGRRLFVLTVTDITEQKRTQAALEHRAFHDTLTGLANRFLFHDRVQQAIRLAARERQHLALLIVDLDRFKEINDTFGHHYGDLLLQRLGPRLNEALRESDTVARLGGDEFALLLPNAGEAGAVATAERLRQALEEPFLIEGHPLVGTGSVGIAIFPQHGEDIETLMRHADIAMYTAKRSGPGRYAVYAPEQDQTSPTRLTLVGEMRSAIEDGQFFLQFQPQVSFATGEAEWVEALARWQHPQRGYVRPDEFIPLAEESGLIEPLTRWVLASALKQARAWQEQGIGLGVAVNLSASTLLDPQLPELVQGLLQRYRVPPAQLRLEITESMIMADPDRAREILTQLSAMGVRLSIDDFGTGYSSLASLRRLPVDELKIDKSFVLEMAAESPDPVIVRSTIDLAHNLGLQVVAEGIETREAWEWLRRLGCDVAQGYYLGHPMTPHELAAWLQRSAAA